MKNFFTCAKDFCICTEDFDIVAADFDICAGELDIVVEDLLICAEDFCIVGKGLLICAEELDIVVVFSDWVHRRCVLWQVGHLLYANFEVRGANTSKNVRMDTGKIRYGDE